MPTELKTGVTNLDKTENVKVISIETEQSPLNFMDALALLFIGLKLTDHLQDWTWIEVLSPLWGPLMVAWFLRLLQRTLRDDTEDKE